MFSEKQRTFTSLLNTVHPPNLSGVRVAHIPFILSLFLCMCCFGFNTFFVLSIYTLFCRYSCVYCSNLIFLNALIKFQMQMWLRYTSYVNIWLPWSDIIKPRLRKHFKIVPFEERYNFIINIYIYLDLKFGVRSIACNLVWNICSTFFYNI